MIKNLMNAVARGYGLGLLLLLLGALSGSAAAQDGNKIWTSVGSTGTVDESAADNIMFGGPYATFRTTVTGPTRAIIRYNVTAVDGLFAQAGPLSWPALSVNYRDDGADARVVVYLREYEFGANPSSPALNTRIVFDSDLYPPSNDYQTRNIGNCGEFQDFQFVPDNQNIRAYFLEVNLVRDSAQGNPGLGALALSRYGVCLTNGR
jgi:hypothetical protein